MADNPPKPRHLRRSLSAPMGVGGYVMEVPRALPVGLHKFFLAKCFMMGYVYKSQGRNKALDFILLVIRRDELTAGRQG